MAVVYVTLVGYSALLGILIVSLFLCLFVFMSLCVYVSLSLPNLTLNMPAKLPHSLSPPPSLFPVVENHFWLEKLFYFYNINYDHIKELWLSFGNLWLGLTRLGVVWLD